MKEGRVSIGNRHSKATVYFGLNHVAIQALSVFFSRAGV